MIAAMIRHETSACNLLYHYCQKDKAQYLLKYGADITARSILKSSNDCDEYRTGVDLFCEYISRKKYVSPSTVESLRNNLHENINYAEIGKSPVVPFAFCLTDRFNSSYHWSEFVKEDGGYCFAFSKEKLAAACRNVVEVGKSSLMLSKCYYVGYDDVAIEDTIEAICRDRADDFRMLEDGNCLDVHARVRIMMQVCSFAMLVKRSRFYPEQEWRVAMVASNAKQQDKDGYLATGVKDVCEFKDVATLMRGVVSSPTNNQGTLCEILSDLLASRAGRAI